MGNRILFILAAYLLFLFAWIFCRGIFGDNLFFVLGLNYLGVWLFTPLLGLIPWVIIRRNWLGGLLLIVPIGLFIWFYGLLFIPRGENNSNTQQQFRIMTFNIRESNRDWESIMQILESNNVEIVALQEVSRPAEEYLDNALLDKYPHRANYRTIGLAVYSQYPILEHRVYSAQPWPFQSTTINIKGTAIHMINAHLAKAELLTFFETGDISRIKDSAIARNGQIKRILGVVERENLPSVVACDCNMTSLTSNYAQITSELNDAFQERGWGFGHTFLIPRGFEISSDINLPFQRIDYLFHSTELGVQSIKVIAEESGSDHRPILAEFALSR